MKRFVDYEAPPVVEVVSGVAFATLGKIKAPHFGLFWNSLKERFPIVEEQPLLSPIRAGPAEIEISNVPPLPRFWFVNEEKGELLQLQKDRFIFNWKREDASPPYPSYTEIYPKFDEMLSTFGKFVRAEKLGELTFRQFELTYVNHIPTTSLAEFLPRPTDVLVDHRRDVSSDRFLPEPDKFNWTNVFSLPKDQGTLLVTAQTAIRAKDNQPLIRLDISARGIGQNGTNMHDWFELAHEWIVRGFADLTDPKIQNEVWRRR